VATTPKQPRSPRARRGRESSAEPTQKTAHDTSGFEEHHVDVPRWRPPISSTPVPSDDESEDAADENAIGDDDDTLRFPLPKAHAPDA
jgi:hypothetical protein